MAKNKTIEAEESVVVYLDAIADENKRKDCTAIIELIHTQTGLKPKMWSKSIVGFGSHHYKYASGHEGDAPLVGLASRANAITLYLNPDFEQKEELLQKFGKHKTGKGCIYIQKLADIDTGILSEMIQNSISSFKNQYSV